MPANWEKKPESLQRKQSDQDDGSMDNVPAYLSPKLDMDTLGHPNRVNDDGDEEQYYFDLNRKNDKAPTDVL